MYHLYLHLIPDAQGNISFKLKPVPIRIVSAEAVLELENHYSQTVCTFEMHTKSTYFDIKWTTHKMLTTKQGEF